MGARLFDNWWTLLILVIVIVLVFASAKLPDMARNLGRSARVLKSEVGEMKKDGKDETVDGKATEVRAEARPDGTRVTETTVREEKWTPEAHAADYDAARPDSRLADPTRSAEANKPSDGTRLN
ncbi:twin-arginine translocase TatA/TatE family subunit [Kytococcus schroeteri]|uniref:twin-arginine translocase TatA/TatE family subunit n=1 Tax=Kytococcus schroeteri TaxID=138300 RepID=UPI0035F0100F